MLKSCINSEIIRYPKNVSEKDILEKIEELNKKDEISGILIPASFAEPNKQEKLLMQLIHPKM